ncbi:PREDICTED: sushi domain-containing protein 1 [Crocodylus porosus]|nr:PREDICTED: sushi domain-containing protein 1 [Crocodylus porosus]
MSLLPWLGLWLGLWPGLSGRPARGQRDATNSSVLDVCATCHIYATCHQKEGKNVCICNYGFVGNGRTYCQDKDECQIGASKICGEYTSCHNTHGSFFCVCLDGYRPSNNNRTFIPNDGTYCTDIDECEVSGLCGHAGQCVNTFGSYKCNCIEGYRPENGTEYFNPSKISCRPVDCGVPPSVEKAYSAPLSRTTYRSEVVYICMHGYVMENGNHTAVCSATGQWEGADLVCKEIDCGRPFWIPHTEMIWDKSTALGSRVYYRCIEGYYFNGDRNFSECTVSQKWENITGVCKVKTAISNVSVFNQTCVRWERSPGEGGLKVVYLFHIQGRRWHQKEIFHERLFNFTAAEEAPEMCLDLPVGTNYTVNIAIVFPEPSVPVTVMIHTAEEDRFSNVSVFNGTCLKWKRHVGRAGVEETYLFHIQGQQGYLEEFSHEVMINFTTEEENPEVCLPLHLDCNYTISITEGSTKFVLQIPIIPPAAEEELLSNVSIFNGTCVKWQRKASRAEVEETYTFHVLRQRWFQKEFSHEMTFDFTTAEANPEVCLELNSGTNYIVNITAASSTEISALITIAVQAEVKEVFSDMLIFNDTCLKWRRNIKRTDMEERYLFHIRGQRWYQQEFFHEMTFNLTTYKLTPEICLDLQPGTNYSVNISITALDLSVLVSMTTEITDPRFPEVKLVTLQSPAPLIRLWKVDDRNGPISFYQVIVLPSDWQSQFACNSLTAATFFSNATNAAGYVAAEFLAKDVADNMSITLGDRHYYGKFYNAPLKRGRDYCVVLRIISEWNKVKRQSCVVWAQLKNISPTLEPLIAVGLGSVASVCFILLLSFSAARFFLYRTVPVPPTTMAIGMSSNETVRLSSTQETERGGDHLIFHRD